MRQLDIIKIPEEWVIAGGKGVKVLIIDGHINTSSELYKKRVSFYKELNKGNCYTTGHCDSVCKVIAETAKFADIGVYQILRNKRTDVFGLQKAFKDIIDMDFDVINLSMSTVKDVHNIKEQVDVLSKKSIIVASMSNNNTISFPAKYDNVISVSSFSNNYQDADVYCEDKIGIVNKTGNSIATAFISGICALAKSYDKGINKDSFLKQLLQK